MNLDETYARARERIPVTSSPKQVEVAARYARTRDPREAERLVLGNLRLVVEAAYDPFAHQRDGVMKVAIKP